jgi:uncharacterized protein YndB with AHSA1/START domain
VAELLTRTIALACPVDHAFDVFTGKVDLWWPRGHRRNRDATMRFDDGALVEHNSDGTFWTMGRVTALEPPHLLALDWFPGSPAAPTSVEVRFAPSADGTTITVTHRALSDGARTVWPERVALFTKGWDTVLPALKAFIEEV